MFLREFYSLQEKPGCNMTEEGRACPEHGLMECPGYKMIETSAKDKLYQRHQEIRKKSGLPNPNYYKELKATFDLPDEDRHAAVAAIKKKYNVNENAQVVKLNDYNQWLDRVDALGAEKHMQKNRTLIVAQSWNGEKVGEFDLRSNQGWVMTQGISEGAGEKLLGKMIPGGASVFNTLDAIRRYKSGDKVGAGIAAAGAIPIVSIPAAAADMARDKYYTGSFLPSDEQRDLANLDRQVADLEKQQWTKLPDGSERSPDGRTIRGPITKSPVATEPAAQGVDEAGPFSYGAKKPRKGSVADLAAKKRKEQEKDRQPAEPKDHMVGVARVVKDVAEGWKGALAGGIAGGLVGGVPGAVIGGLGGYALGGNNPENLPDDPELAYKLGQKAARNGKSWEDNPYEEGIFGPSEEMDAWHDGWESIKKGVAEEAKKGLYYYVNKRKKAGTSRPKGHPKSPSAQDWKDAAKTAKNESMTETDPGISKDKETKFHAKLDTLVHDTFGKRKDELEESMERYLEELERAGYGIVEEKVRLDKKCWKGKKIGNPKTKMKGGVRVNNCVPK